MLRSSSQRCQAFLRQLQESRMAVTGSAKGPHFCRGGFVADLPRRFAGGLENPSGAAISRSGDRNPIGGRVFHELRSPQSERLLAKWSKGAKRSSVWGSNRRLKAPQRAIELTRDLQHAESVAAKQFGVQASKSRAEY